MKIDDTIKLALQHFRAEQYQDAKTLFQRVYEHAPEFVIPQIYLAQLAVLDGTGSAWIQRLETLLRKKPFMHEAYHTLGLCYQQNRLLPQASQAFYQALGARCFQSSAATSVLPKQVKTFVGFDRIKAEELLWSTLAELKQQGIHAFATAGTLLGLERTGQLLENDKDIDIGIDWLQMSNAIEVLTTLGWQEVSHSYGLINPRCFKHRSSGIIMDICGYGTETLSGETISGLWMDQVPFDWNRITYFPPIKLSSKHSPAGEIWHLSAPDAFLAILYGENWRVPDPYFDTIVSAANLRHFSWLALCYGYSRLYGEWSKGNTQKALGILATLRRHQTDDPMLTDIAERLTQATKLTQPSRVLALGYFDLFHQGHLNYLNHAKQQGDTLVVGVAPDAFGKQSKGYVPVMSEQDRMAILSALSVVDEVHLVSAPMSQTEAAAQWIKSLNVNTVVCGEEWQGSERWNALSLRLEKDHIAVLYAPRTANISTTDLKNYILKTLNETHAK
ncbi:glycerol-3-phosphate cytidylyltransferase [Marinomonas polaris DSM 16579]|uniref:Glycerol-3-phosphate cytidylyltransferase n=1 Tax=Marinomonas polaris DSM 16579 TaxID=1122206 RepID=A0A1M4X6I7_9GAMM|nr:adenylyltransferase/cytidyltransferase family protein [Marinomonas polaris]SHE89110.1 glycerol-3-phosphate cytidylyltransferase [Marinomonas polaris DSM 16579]